MLPLLASCLPESRETLLKNLEAGLAEAFHTTPHIHSTPDTLQIRLDTPQFSQIPKFPTAGAPRDANPILDLRHFLIEAPNARFQNTPFSVECHFEDAPLFWVPHTDTHSALGLRNPRTGTIRIRIQPADLEKLVSTRLSELAESQGFELQECALQPAPLPAEPQGTLYRAIEVQLKLKAGAFLMATTLTLSGRVRVTDDLHLAFENLSCEGKGMAASAAKVFLEPQFKRLASQPFPIASGLPAGLPLHSAGWEFIPNPETLGLVAVIAAQVGEQ